MPNFKNDPVISVSNSTSTPAVQGESSGNAGVHGTSHNTHSGVVGINDAPLPGGDGGWFESSQGEGVRGWSKNPNHGGVVGVNTGGGNGGWFESDQGEGVRGWSKNPNYGGVVGVNTAGGVGLSGLSDSGIAVLGESQNNEGVRGISHSAHSGVFGINDAPLPGGDGGWFESSQGEGVRGWSKNPNHGGVVGVNTGGGNGGWFESDQGEGVRGWAKNPDHGGVVGVNTGGGAGIYGTSDSNGIAVWGKGGRLAALFEGDVEVTGDIRLTNADCAEDFDIMDADLVEPGTVMVLGGEGALQPSEHAYDKRVAGVISGAGGYKPGIVLDKQESRSDRKPLALLGKVYCKVDAQYGAVEMGDLLTTSSTPGHAMKADDPLKAFGSVIGKALRPLTEGRGLVPILIALQ